MSTKTITTDSGPTFVYAVDFHTDYPFQLLDVGSAENSAWFVGVFDSLERVAETMHGIRSSDIELNAFGHFTVLRVLRDSTWWELVPYDEVELAYLYFELF